MAQAAGRFLTRGEARVKLSPLTYFGSMLVWLRATAAELDTRIKRGQALAYLIAGGRTGTREGFAPVSCARERK